MLFVYRLIVCKFLNPPNRLKPSDLASVLQYSIRHPPFEFLAKIQAAITPRDTKSDSDASQNILAERQKQLKLLNYFKKTVKSNFNSQLRSRM